MCGCKKFSSPSAASANAMRDWRVPSQWWPVSSTALPYFRCNLALAPRAHWIRLAGVQMKPALAFYLHPRRGVHDTRALGFLCRSHTFSATQSNVGDLPSGGVPLRNLNSTHVQPKLRPSVASESVSCKTSCGLKI